MNRLSCIVAAVLAVNGLGIGAVALGADANPNERQADNQMNQAVDQAKTATNNGADAVQNAGAATTNKASGEGDKVRNTLEQAGAGTPTAAKPAPDGDDIRSTLADLTNEAITKNDMGTLEKRFVDADRNRLDKEADKASDDDFSKKMDGRIAQIQKAWKEKYGNDFDISKQNIVFGDQFASIQQGRIGDDAQLASIVMANSANANMSTKDNANGNDKGDENLEKGRSIAVVDIKASHGLPELKVPLIHELPDSWKINVPDSLTNAKLRQNLMDQLTAIGNMTDQWPKEETDAYRAVSHHVLMAVLDIHGE